ncbi:ABC transporter permease [Draconibacterium sp.]
MKRNILFSIRNILRNRINSLITIIGISISFTVLLLIYIYVNQEFSYNHFHHNKDLIYRVDYKMKYANGQEDNTVYLDQEVSKIIKEKIPLVKYSAAFRTAHGPILKFENRNFDENVLIAQADFFRMFTFNVLFGDKQNLLENPDEIAITSSLADKLQAVKGCTKQELIGQAVFFPKAGDIPFTISAILENVPENSSIQFDAVIPYKYQRSFNQSNNIFGNSSVFYQLISKNDAKVTADLITAEIAELYNDGVQKNIGRKVLIDSKDAFTPSVTPLKEVYLDEASSDNESRNSKSSLYILMAIGMLILIIAGSNFILLSVGQSLKKAADMNIRKMMGANFMHIFNLQLTENLLVVSMSFVVAAVGAFFLIPTFNRLASTQIYTRLIPVGSLVLFAFFSILLIAVLTSIAPFLKLIAKKPGLQNTEKTGLSHKNLVTGIFVTMQYSLSIILIVLTISIVRQTNYMKYTDLGFSSDNIIDLEVYHLTASEKIALRDQFETYPGITDLTLTNRNYISGESSEYIKNQAGENIRARILKVDANYVSTLGLQLIQGRDFTEETVNSHSILINEQLMNSLDLGDDAVGKFVELYGTNYQILGLISDFHFDSMKDAIEPLILVPSKGEDANFMFIKYNPVQLSQLIPYLKTTWEKVAPDKAMKFNFWDEQLNQRYHAEEKWSHIIGYAAVIAIIISSLGLFGLTLLIINKRIKEIGIRKVNGAKISEILTMLNKDFVKWVAIAFVIATPIAYYAMQKWLENFAYKTDLSWWIFALAGLLALGVALLTVSFQSWKAATKNPVESLRYE